MDGADAEITSYHLPFDHLELNAVFQAEEHILWSARKVSFNSIWSK